ncbi:MAG TPA: hypothetical protein VLA37_02185 [Sphingomonadaceae bacterium]|nr:hypothetical protein [Sphingomonadaceae bacterium]
MGESPILPGRSCGSCTLCCRILGVDEIGKTKGEWCRYCDVGKGCTIYRDRPGECRDFYCGWLTLPMVDEKWFPARSKMVVYAAPDGKQLEIHVDPGRPDAWRAEPFYSEIRGWARAVAGRDFRIVVVLGAKAWLVRPDGEEEVGAS